VEVTDLLARDDIPEDVREWLAQRLAAGGTPDPEAARLRHAFDDAAVGLCVVAPGGVLSDVNARFCEIVGRERDELVGTDALTLTLPEDLDEEIALIRAAVRGEVDGFALEKRITRADGAAVWVLSKCTVIRAASGAIEYSIGVMQDISQRKATEQQLILNAQRQEALYQLNQMTDASADELAAFAMEEAVRLTGSAIGYVAFANEDETELTMHAWSAQAMRECRIDDKPLVYPIAHTGLWGEAVRQRRPVITNDYSADNPLKKGTPEGHVGVTRHVNVPIFDEGRVVIVAGVGNKPADYDEGDVRQLTLLMEGMWRMIRRREAEDALRLTLEEDGRFLERLVGLNVAAAELTRCRSVDELCQRAVELRRDCVGFDRLSIWLVDEDGAHLLGTFGVDEAGEIRDERGHRVAYGPEAHLFRLQSERNRYLLWRQRKVYDHLAQVVGTSDSTQAPLWDGDRVIGSMYADNLLSGEPAGERQCELLSLYAGIVGNLIARLRAEEQRRVLEAGLQHGQRLESLSVLAGGVAHEFNNILTGVIGNLELALMQLGEDSPVRETLGGIERLAARAARLSRQMLAYAATGGILLSEMDLAGLVREVTDALRRRLPSGVELRVEPADGLPPIAGNVGQLTQLVEALVVNASEALPERRGEIGVSAEVRQIGAALLKEAYPVGYDLVPGPFVCIEVTDRGHGMDAATLERMFEPFFSTRFAGRGLGLAVALGVVRGHRGGIHVRSRPGLGTTVTVFLPPAGPVAPGSAALAEDADATQAPVILVIDDDEAIRAVSQVALEREGYAVLAAADGEGGLEVFDRAGEAIALVLLDLTLPGIDGGQVFEAIRARRPEVPVVLVSGYGRAAVHGRLAALGPAGVVEKPYRLEELLAAVREALGEGTPRRAEE
jgi:PAS domain S-box-containing protein